MPTGWVLENVDGGIFTPNTSSTSDWHAGTACYCLVDGLCTGLRWYRASSAPDQRPVNLRLWNAVTATLLYETTDIPDSGSVGWQEYTIPDPVEVPANTRLMASAGWVEHWESAIAFVSVVQPSPYPAVLGVEPGFYSIGESGGMPAALGSNWLLGTDARFETPPPSTEGSLLAETTFTTAIKWVQEADFYLVTITTSPQTRYERDADGVIVSRLIGSWSPLEGDYAGQRYQMDYKQMKLILPAGQHMTGVSVALLQGAEATLQAWSIGT